MLAELQRAFAAELLAGGARTRVHRATAIGALADALAATHPVCVRLVGDDFFRALARGFAHEVPSRSPDLNDYGAELGDHLERFEPARALPYLADVARLEWALHRARHSALAPPLDLARLALRLAPGTALVASPYPVDRIWQTNQPSHTGDATVSLDEGEALLVVAREPEGARFTRVSRAELELFRGLGRGLSLDDAAAGWPDSAESLAETLARAARRRWLG